MPACSTPGSTKWRSSSQPVSLAEVERFEARLGVPLPAGFRALLLRAGAGAGPYYGVWRPKRIWDETNSLGCAVGRRGADLDISTTTGCMAWGAD
ncbi:SMI1/KNR4 family protein [Corallococcus macrosporus]|uniref:SMI1/KNR4 family protein n=1 Tax=Corallococcus macrosporus TaxID=35 RepID=UPI003B832CF7